MANTTVPAELSSTPSISDNGNATAITINSDENIGIGTSTIDTTYSGYVGLELGAQAVINGNRTTGDTGVTSIGQNAYLSSASGGSWKYKESGKAALIQGVDDGSIRFLTTDTTGSADDALTWSERGRFLSSGGLTFNGDTSTANALDDYEEGSWTPTLPNGGTVLVRTATYTKVGRHVMAYMYCQFAPTNNSSTFNIGGLPYTVVNNSNYYGGGSLSYSGTEDTSSFSDPLTHYNANFIYFHYLTGSSLSIKNSQFGGRTINLILQVHYETAA